MPSYQIQPRKIKKERSSSTGCLFVSCKPEVCHMGNPNRMLAGRAPMSVCHTLCYHFPTRLKAPALISPPELRVSLKCKDFSILLTQCQENNSNTEEGEYSYNFVSPTKSTTAHILAFIWFLSHRFHGV